MILVASETKVAYQRYLAAFDAYQDDPTPQRGAELDQARAAWCAAIAVDEAQTRLAV